MANAFLLLFVTPVSALLDSSVLSLFFSPQILLFADTWDDSYINYQLFADVSFAATCDWTLSGYVAHVINPDDSSCGLTCKLLQKDFSGSMPAVRTAYSPSDHVTMTTFRKKESACDSVGSILNCQIDKVGSFFTDQDAHGVVWFLAFRGTFMWDVVNHRRNAMTTLVLVSICEQCAASDGPYRNFVALRFSVARLLLLTGTAVPSAQLDNLAVVGTSMGGQLAQFTVGFLSAERSIISQDVFALVTHGSPRVANRQLGRHINAGVDVPYVQFAYYRDLVPHLPPMVWGFRSASPKIMWIFVEPSFWIERSMGDEPKVEKSLKYKEFVGDDADGEFAHQLAFYDTGDHMRYFAEIDEFVDLAACGGMEDKFFLNTFAMSLYDNV
jgi:hypothetical protein